jgi:hypothetical protein
LNKDAPVIRLLQFQKSRKIPDFIVGHRKIRPAESAREVAAANRVPPPRWFASNLYLQCPNLEVE